MQQPQMSRFAVLSASPPATCITLVCSCTSDAGHTWHNEIRMYKAQVLYPQNLIGMIPTGGTNNCWDVLLCSMFASMYFCFKKLQSESVCKQGASPLPRIFQLNPSLHLPASLVVRAEGSAAPQTPESWWAEHGHIESWSITKHHKVRLVSKGPSPRFEQGWANWQKLQSFPSSEMYQNSTSERFIAIWGSLSRWCLICSSRTRDAFLLAVITNSLTQEQTTWRERHTTTQPWKNIRSSPWSEGELGEIPQFPDQNSALFQVIAFVPNKLSPFLSCAPTT